jgi:hypothetical protein
MYYNMPSNAMAVAIAGKLIYQAVLCAPLSWLQEMKKIPQGQGQIS